MVRPAPVRDLVRSRARRLRGDGARGHRPRGHRRRTSVPRKPSSMPARIDEIEARHAPRRDRVPHPRRGARRRAGALAAPRDDLVATCSTARSRSCCATRPTRCSRAATSCWRRFRVRIDEHRKTPMMGRSHGIHAEPITFGVALAGHFAEIARGTRASRAARDEIAVGKIAGAVGTYAHLTPADRAEALAQLGLRPETVSTQVVARDRHAALRRRHGRHGRGHRALRHQRAPLAAHRGRRGRRVLQPGPEGLERDAAQAQPRAHREPVRPGARRARRRGARCSRTWRSGTSATSRTRRSSA